MLCYVGPVSSPCGVMWRLKSKTCGTNKSKGLCHARSVTSIKSERENKLDEDQTDKDP